MAATPSVTPGAYTKKVKPGGRLELQLAVRDAGWCRLRSPGLSLRFSVAGARLVEVGVRLRRRTHPGLYRLTVSCGRPRSAVKVRVTGKAKRGERRLAASRAQLAVLERSDGGQGQPGLQGPVTDLLAPSPAAPPEDLASRAAETAALAAAQDKWDSRGLGWLLRNGECTEYAGLRRPDVFERIMVRYWADRALHPATAGHQMDAHYWNDYAQRAGLTVSATPVPGAIAVFERGVDAASSRFGHVAYVEDVSRDGTFRVTEQNGAVHGSISERITARAPGVTFIH